MPPVGLIDHGPQRDQRALDGVAILAFVLEPAVQRSQRFSQSAEFFRIDLSRVGLVGDAIRQRETLTRSPRVT
jgi:hypothetical protein